MPILQVPIDIMNIICSIYIYICNRVTVQNSNIISTLYVREAIIVCASVERAVLGCD